MWQRPTSARREASTSGCAAKVRSPAVARLLGQGRTKIYVETISLTLTAFLLMLPTITETLRRVPDGHPLVTDFKSPILLGAHGTLFVFLIVGLTAQIVYLRRQGWAER